MPVRNQRHLGNIYGVVSEHGSGRGMSANVNRFQFGNTPIQKSVPAELEQYAF